MDKKGEWVFMHSLKGRKFEVIESYDTELVMRDIFSKKQITIVLEDSGLGYGEDRYTEDLVMNSYEKSI